MKREVSVKTVEYIKSHKMKRSWWKVMTGLAAVVVFCTVYALILPAITMEGNTCGQEEHTHGEECYRPVNVVPICTYESLNLHEHTDACKDENGEYCCGYADYVIHRHNDSCYTEDGTLWCPLPEITEHVHSQECYAFQEIDSENVESSTIPENHIHTDECYELRQGELCCTGHIHDDSCFVLICEEEHEHGDGCYEIVQEACHQHDETCYVWERLLICGQSESVEPERSDGQSENVEPERSDGQSESVEPERSDGQSEGVEPERICGLEEITLHEHTQSCYDAEGHWICGQLQITEHVHSENCFAITEDAQILNCTIPEHIHDPGCYDENGQLICQFEEDECHQHSKLCYGTWELVCGLEEHKHSLSCLADLTADVETAADWEKTLLPLELTGVWNEDVLTIAKSQLGYKESERNYIVEPDGETKKGYTRYGAWYGDPYGDWCAMFVSFCLNYAGVPEEAFPQEASCPRWVEILKGQELYAAADEGYQPSAGDVVFFDMDADWSADHVGLIREPRYDGGTELIGFTTIEGNSSDQVVEREYALEDASILGYGVLSIFSEMETLDIGGDYGYNPDGSIYWTNVTYKEVAADAIQPNIPYVIAGNSRRNVMSSVPNGNVMQTVRPLNVSEYQNYAIWYFEETDSGYRIYTDQDSPRYLKLTRNALSVTDSVDEATVFTVAQATLSGYTDRVVIGADGNYLNAYGDDLPSCSGWGSWNQPDSGSCLKIMEPPEIQRETARRLETVNSANTVIHLFDYWTNPAGQSARDDTDYMYDGINKDHNLKFYKNTSTYNNSPEIQALGLMNKLEEYGVIKSGIVMNRLENGYPRLSGDAAMTGGSDESLDYLFDPYKEAEGKTVYSDVGGLLRIDDEGYYFFDSKETMAEYKEKEHTIALYDHPGVLKKGSGTISASGQFFPLNCAPEVMRAGSTDSIINHYLGLTITTRFIQRYSGFTDSSEKRATTFSFKGDDDVWIFIDGVLVADLGGARASVDVDIDFSTGKITTTYTDGSNRGQTSVKTLRELYESAGALEKTKWSESEQNTFADNTTHTLKFFYLERGNWDSNLYLKYNLAEIPKTAIYKVDQYGEKVEGATFAVYAANEDYQMMREKGGPIVDEPSDPQYDDAGNMIGPDGDIIAHALYRGTTNAKGEMIFVDGDGMPYSLNELEELFGRYFILREIHVPEGYRIVSKDVNLQIWHGADQVILKCDNTVNSGSRAASTLQVMATDILHIDKPYKGKKEVQYCDEEGNPTGTLFAVVFKYVGEADENGIYSDENWRPVYGSDLDGYNLVDIEGRRFMDAVLEAARKARDYGAVEFSRSASSNMQLTMENLPGHITTYYRMLDKSERAQAKYTVAYYWTPDTLDTAEADNLYRVYTFAEATEDGKSYSSFERIFGANIQVPNLVNNVLVQKVDENDERIDGATFALYSVRQQEDGSIWYKTEDGYVPLGENPKVNEDGTITTVNGTIQPLKIGITQTYDDGIHTGTTGFSNLEDGQYIVKEVKAPAGYALNTADVMVLVTEDTIYANAGTEDDGITVGRGPGYVVDTLDKFASLGQIDNTLSWIYTMMKITGVSDRFSDALDESKTAGYLTENNTGNVSQNEENALRAYLRYENIEGEAVFNYVPNMDRTVENGARNPSGTRRLFTTVGWTHYKIYQDYEYGKTAKNATANYEDWSEHELTNLFSRSTYIRVRDVQRTELQVKKVSEANKEYTLADAWFRLYRLTDAGVKEYYCRSGEKVSWKTEEMEAMVVKTGEDGLSDERFTGLSDGVYYLEETKAPQGFCLPLKPVKLNIYHAVMTIVKEKPSEGQEISEELQDDNSYLYTVTVPNSTGHKLPDTGGVGTDIFREVGWPLTVGAAVLFTVRKRRGRR